jgi:hypothetical protein
MNRTVAAGAACFAAGLALWPLGRSVDHADRLRGTITVYAPVDATAGCGKLNGFDDIAGGATVQASDTFGNVLAAGTLGPGKLLADKTGCSFAFTLGKLKETDAVVLSVGSRQGLKLTATQLNDVDYRVDLRLGATA